MSLEVVWCAGKQRVPFLELSSPLTYSQMNSALRRGLVVGVNELHCYWVLMQGTSRPGIHLEKGRLLANLVWPPLMQWSGSLL